MSQPDTRAAFEAWCRKEQGYLYKDEAEPGTPQEDKWLGWQAAIDHVGGIQQQSPEPCKDPAACEAQGCCNPRGRCEEAARQPAPASAQPSDKLDAEKLDAERYRWLRERDTTIEGIGFTAFIPELGHDGTALDWAIDAARASNEAASQDGGVDER